MYGANMSFVKISEVKDMLHLGINQFLFIFTTFTVACWVKFGITELYIIMFGHL